MELKLNINHNNRTEPVYLQIKKELLKYASEHEFCHGSMMPSVKLVAEAAKVSLRTADQALCSLINDGYCYRRPKKGTFFSESCFAKRMVCGTLFDYRQPIENNLVAFELQRGVALRCAELNVELVPLNGDIRDSIRFYNRQENFDLRGGIVLDNRLIQETLSLSGEFPDQNFIFLNYRLQELADAPDNLYSVLNDDNKGAYQMVEYFAAKDLKNAAVLSMKLFPDDLTYKTRAMGFVNSIKEFGMICDNETDLLICPKESESMEILQNAYDIVYKYLSSGKHPDIIFAVNDWLAIGALRALADLKLDGTVKVSGYDCITSGILGVSPDFSIKVDYSQMGKHAVDALVTDKKFPRLQELAPCLHIKQQ